jgi:hypothetical protein
VKEGRTLFVDTDADKWPAYPDQLAYVASVPRIPEAMLDAIITDRAFSLLPTGRRHRQEWRCRATEGRPVSLTPCAAKAYLRASPARGGPTGRTSSPTFPSARVAGRGHSAPAARLESKNKPEPLPPDKIVAMVHTAYVKEYTSLGCEYLKGPGRFAAMRV